MEARRRKSTGNSRERGVADAVSGLRGRGGFGGFAWGRFGSGKAFDFFEFNVGGGFVRFFAARGLRWLFGDGLRGLRHTRLNTTGAFGERRALAVKDWG